MKNQILVVQKGLAFVDKHNHPLNGYHYHNLLHSKDVVEQSGILAKEIYGTNSYEFNGIQRAAAWHDAVQNLGSFDNELESARREAKCAQKNGFTLEETTFDCTLILGTICVFTNSVMHQNAELMELPAQVLADADLCALGMEPDDFIFRAQCIIAEFGHKVYLEMTDAEKLKGWQTEVNFLTNRKFLTEAANDLWLKNLQENFKVAKKYAGL